MQARDLGALVTHLRPMPFRTWRSRRQVVKPSTERQVFRRTRDVEEMRATSWTVGCSVVLQLQPPPSVLTHSDQ